MEPAQILLTASVLLAVGAAAGLVMAGIRFVGDRSPPAALAMLHGFLAAAAVTLLLNAAATVGLPKMALVALALFLAAAGGGAILNLNYHWKQRPAAPPLRRSPCSRVAVRLPQGASMTAAVSMLRPHCGEPCTVAPSTSWRWGV
jgi:hypothetical protein